MMVSRVLRQFFLDFDGCYNDRDFVNQHFQFYVALEMNSPTLQSLVDTRHRFSDSDDDFLLSQWAFDVTGRAFSPYQIVSFVHVSYELAQYQLFQASDQMLLNTVSRVLSLDVVDVSRRLKVRISAISLRQIVAKFQSLDATHCSLRAYDVVEFS